MKKAAMLLGNGFEEGEVIITHDVLGRANIQVELISVHDNLAVTSSQNVVITANTLIQEVKNFDKFDCLIIPGGSKGVQNIIACSEALIAIKKFYQNEKLLAAICAGPLALHHAGILADHHFTVWPDLATEITGLYEAKPAAVVDQNIITSQSLGTTFAFAMAIVTRIADPDKVHKLRDSIIYRDIHDIKVF